MRSSFETEPSGALHFISAQVQKPLAPRRPGTTISLPVLLAAQGTHRSPMGKQDR